MIKYEDGALCSSDGTKLSTARLSGRAVFYAHHVIFAMHHGYVPERVGRVDGDINNDRIENLYDMSFGKPVINVEPVKNDPLLKILKRHPLITDREMAAIQRPLPEHVIDTVLGFFRDHGVFVPIDETVVDKATGGIKIRRFIVEYLAAKGDLWYDGECFRSTSAVT